MWIEIFLKICLGISYVALCVILNMIPIVVLGETENKYLGIISFAGINTLLVLAALAVLEGFGVI